LFIETNLGQNEKATKNNKDNNYNILETEYISK